MPPNVADIQGGKAVLRASQQRHSPKDVSRILAQHGINLCAKRIRQRCRLPKSHPLHIQSLPTFGLIWIPDSEVFRLLGIEEDVS